MKAIFERIAKSLEVIATEIKAENQVRIEMMNRMETMETMLKDFAENPLGIKEKE